MTQFVWRWSNSSTMLDVTLNWDVTLNSQKEKSKVKVLPHLKETWKPFLPHPHPPSLEWGSRLLLIFPRIPVGKRTLGQPGILEHIEFYCFSAFRMSLGRNIVSEDQEDFENQHVYRKLMKTSTPPFSLPKNPMNHFPFPKNDPKTSP